GRALCEAFGRRFVVEVRTVNHRFLDIKLRLPWIDATLETHIQQTMKARLARGAVTLTMEGAAEEGAAPVQVDVPLARRYHQALTELARALGRAAEDIPLATIVE